MTQFIATSNYSLNTGVVSLIILEYDQSPQQFYKSTLYIFTNNN